jgi:nudix-type nucleoside diphosphatase (YffH/AdpP family)
MHSQEIFPEKEEEVFSYGRMIIQKASLLFRKNGKELRFDRLRVKRPDAVAVFIFNRDSGKVVLVRQYRYPIADRTKEPVLEIMAGKIDGNDDPVITAIREAEEECGYRLNKDQLRQLAEFFASPGYTSERFYLFYAEVRDSDRISDGGGLEEENEYIEIVEMGYVEFERLLETGKIEDAKTLIAALYVDRLKLIRN